MRQSLLVPLSLIVAGGIVAVSVYVYFHARATHIAPGAGNPADVRPLDDTDHILGNPTAAVMLIEYSDIDCPFCKNFTKTMEETMARYGASGNVAWTYRHLPITEQHPNAALHAEAAECVAAQGGTSAFFRFIDAVNAAAPGTTQFNPTGYGTVIQNLGLNADTFNSCMTSHSYKKHVDDDATNALAAGASGAPYTVILIKGLPPISIAGAFSSEQMKDIIEVSLDKAGVK